MVLTRSSRDVSAESVTRASALNVPFLYTAPSNISGAGLGLYTTRPIAAGEPIAWYEGEVHTVKTCSDSDYCASRTGSIHVDGIGIARFANDAYKSSFKNNARMEWLTKDAIGFAWPFLMARTAINAHTEILYSYGDKYW
jgi:hypothetical protein